MGVQRKYSYEGTDVSAAERVAQLKATRSNGSRAIATPAAQPTPSRCVMEIDVSRDLIDRMSDEQVYDFLRGDGSDVLMEAFLSARSVVIPRGVSGEVSCSADSKGNFECKGTVRF